MLAGIVPRFRGTETVLLAASMLGATVMPHAVYLHSSLARDRSLAGRDSPGFARLLRANKWDVLLALAVAGGVNLAMLLLAASSLSGATGADTIQGAADAVEQRLGATVGVLFGIGLLASGLASTSVGTYAGAEITSGLLRARIPLAVQRVMTLAPALLVLAIGIEPTRALVLSQVVLSFGIPFALVPLIRLTSQREVMGVHANTVPMRTAAIMTVALIVTLNVVLVAATLLGPKS
jgi:manganese transport protein